MSSLPLAEKLRPQSLTDMVGQEHLLGQEGWITRNLKQNHPFSILLWGPPGCGKTTLARLYAKEFDATFLTFSGVLHGVNELKKAILHAKEQPLFTRRLIIFIDEIHRFNKAQQDALLPFVEDGTIILIGATTENPSFSLNNALLSRLHTLILHPLTDTDLLALLERHAPSLPLTKEAQITLVQMAQGDGRHLLNMVENLALAPRDPLLTPDELPRWVQQRAALYDRNEEQHYNLISALHKSIRGSDPDGALYWFCRMLEGGESPAFLARRLIRMASEDIGLADPNALEHALNGWHSFAQLGSPEGELALAQVVIYLALAPKSNAVYLAYKKAQKAAKNSTQYAPPKIILNSPTRLMSELGYGKGYKYDHEEEDRFSGQNYFPEEMDREQYYDPVELGFERELKKRVKYFQSLRKKKNPPRAAMG